MSFLESSSTRPYLLRAMHEWCMDNGLTPYLAVMVDATVRVPHEHVKDGEIVLNISPDATSHLQLGNEFVEFKCRFSGKVRDVAIPIGQVAAIYARENGQGLTFPVLCAKAAEGGEKKLASSRGSKSGTQQETSGPEPKEAKVMQLVPGGKGVDSIDGDSPPPKPRKPTSGVRPALKSVK